MCFSVGQTEQICTWGSIVFSEKKRGKKKKQTTLLQSFMGPIASLLLFFVIIIWVGKREEAIVLFIGCITPHLSLCYTEVV